MRLYVAESLPGALVTPQNTERRKKALLPKVTTRAFDQAGKTIVPTYENFIGRRRQLQNCIKNLKDSEAVGVLIYGMGGLGKSSIAARLCDRLSKFQPLVWVGEIDQAKLVGLITDKLDSQQLREILQKPDEDLKYRLKQVLKDSQERFLFVLDDFEANLEPRSQTYILKTEAVSILDAIVWAIAETNFYHRIIITCRYQFDSPLLKYFAKQPLDGFKGADLEKKCKRLDAFSIDSEVDETIQLQAIKLADGNPRLLEWLDKILPDEILDRQKILDRLEINPVELREQVLADSLLQQIDDSIGELLSRGLVFELSVPREAIKTICESISGVDDKIDRAIALGLLEVSPDESLRVPRILPIQLPEDRDALYQQAAEVLYRLWWTETEIKIGTKGLEIYRLATLAKAKDIVVSIGLYIAHSWVSSSHYQSALRMCQNTLEVGEDYFLFNTIARAEEALGLVDEAIEHYEKALELCPDEDIEKKAAILNNMAETIARKDLNRGLPLYFQCLELCKSSNNLEAEYGATVLYNMASTIALHRDRETAQKIWDVCLKRDDLPALILAGILNAMAASPQQGTLEERLDLMKQSLQRFEQLNNVEEAKAIVLSNMADLKVLQGDKKSALQLYRSSLAYYEQIQNLKGKSATLNHIAGIIAEQGEVEKALELWPLAAQDSITVKDYPNLVNILANWGWWSENKVYFAQAIWLSLKILTSLEIRIHILRAFCHFLSPQDPLLSLLGSTVLYLCDMNEQEEPRLEEFQDLGRRMLTAAAKAQNITEDESINWVVGQRLNDPNYFLPELIRRLEAIVGNEWMFDHAVFTTPNQSDQC